MPSARAVAEADGACAAAPRPRGVAAGAPMRLSVSVGGRRRARPGGRTKVAGGMDEMMRDGASESQDDMGSTTAPTRAAAGSYDVR